MPEEEEEELLRRQAHRQTLQENILHLKQFEYRMRHLQGEMGAQVYARGEVEEQTHVAWKHLLAEMRQTYSIRSLNGITRELSKYEQALAELKNQEEKPVSSYADRYRQAEALHRRESSEEQEKLHDHER